MTAPVLRHVAANGIRLACFEHGVASADSPTLLFVHCTGFHGRIWDRIIEALPGCHALALEQRGHGRSDKTSIDHWDVFGQDMSAFVEALALKDIIGVGHSLGAHAMVDAAAATGAFERLVLCDPTIAAPEAYGKRPADLDDGRPHPTARRRAVFESPAEMATQLRPKGSYSLFDERMFNDYCEYGLVPGEDGQLTLACPPAFEASVYTASRTNAGVFESARALDIPVHILRAKEPAPDRARFDFSTSPTWPDLVHEFKNAHEDYLPDCTHFIPMHMPERVIDAVKAAMAAWKTARGQVA